MYQENRFCDLEACPLLGVFLLYPYWECPLSFIGGSIVCYTNLINAHHECCSYLVADITPCNVPVLQRWIHSGSTIHFQGCRVLKLAVQ